jgi:hypothetical protein
MRIINKKIDHGILNDGTISAVASLAGFEVSFDLNCPFRAEAALSS